MNNSKMDDVYCVICNKFVYQCYKSSYRRRKTCSKACHDALILRNLTGKSNPNYRGGVTYDKICSSCGGKMDYRAKVCVRCRNFNGENNTFYGRKHTKKSKLLISKGSSAKFTPEFNKIFHDKMVSLGNWTAKEDKSDYAIYSAQCQWIARMFDIKDISNFELTKLHGVYSAQFNARGCVRDHKFSKRGGFELQVFPEILRHPCNCQVILHADNVRKRHHDVGYGKDNTISLDMLFAQIFAYTNIWKEHDVCMQRIKEYLNGERWKRT